MPHPGNIGKRFELISAGVDYATFTTGLGNRAVRAWDMGRDLLQVENNCGNSAKPWRSFGYVGWASSHITVGRRADGSIVRLSGELAQQYWRTFHAVSDRCTRLDLAVTGHTDATSFGVANLALREARAWKRQHDSRLTVGYHFSEPGGATVTIGARSSEKYGRIYDKWAEKGSPYSPGDWRWEVEYKGAHALSLATELYAENNRSERIGGLTMAFFAERGISVPFAASGGQWRYTARPEKVDAEKRLEWIRTNVRPMVHEIAYQVGEKSVLDALGLWPDNCPDLYQDVQMRLEGVT